MDTMFLLYTDPTKTAQTPEARADAMARHWAIMDDAVAQGKYKGASPLQAPATALTVARSASGGVTVTDGPFAETKEALGGYYILDCADSAEAKRWAERFAYTGAITTVEIRPLAPLPQRVQNSTPAHAHA